MAEAVGVVAAAVEFVNVGLRVFEAISKLYSALEKAPRRVQRANIELLRFVTLTAQLEKDIAASAATPHAATNAVFSSETATEVSLLLNDAIAEVIGLEMLLKGLSPNIDDNRIRKKWRVVVAMHKEEEIQERLEALEVLKGTLGLWYHHENFVVANEQLKVANVSNANLQALMTKMTLLQQELNDFRREASTSGNGTEQMVLHMAEKIKHEIVGQASAIENKQTSIENTLSHLSHQIENVDQNIAQQSNTAVQLRPADQNRLLNQLCLRLASKPALAQRIASLHSDISDSENLGSTLSSHRQIYRSREDLQNLITRRRRDKIVLDELDSSLLHSSRRVRKYSFHLLLPRVLGYAIKTTFALTFGAGGFSIGSSLMPIPVVSRWESAAFLAINRAFESFDFCRYSERYYPNRCFFCQENNISSANSKLERLRRDLSQLFVSGQASARDQTPAGETLLRNFVDHLLRVVLFRIHDDVFKQSVSAIVSLLVAGGVDINAPVEFGESILYIILHPLIGAEPRKAPFISVDRVLVDHGWEIALSTSKQWQEARFKWILLMRNHHLAIDAGYDRFSLAVITRSESTLRSIIENNIDQRSKLKLQRTPTDTDQFDALCLAVGWPAGMLILLKEGWKPNYEAMTLAISKQEESCVSILIDYHCPLQQCQGSQWPECPPVLALADEYGNPKIKTLIANALASARLSLASLAFQHLSDDERTLCGYHASEMETKILDKSAYNIAALLEKKGVTLHPRLWPHSNVSVFYNTSENYYSQVSASMFEALYECGFQDFDVSDLDGRSPLFQGSFLDMRATRKDSVEWLLEKGSRDTFNTLGVLNCAHALAHSMATHVIPLGNMFSANQGLVLQKMPTASLMARDSCNCYCSDGGCLPTTNLLKRTQRDCDMVNFPIRLGRLFRWFTYAKLSKELAEDCCTEVCRLDIFERLGMGHTCCVPAYVKRKGVFEVKCLSTPCEEERKEMHTEDAELIEVLESYVELYKALKDEHSASFLYFWAAWWRILHEFLPELPVRPYTHRWSHDQIREEQRLVDGELQIVKRFICGHGQVGVGRDSSGIPSEMGYGPDHVGIRKAVKDMIGAYNSGGSIGSPCIRFDDDTKNLFGSPEIQN